MTVPPSERSSKSRTPRENSFLIRISQKTAPRKNSRRKNRSCDFIGKLRKNAEAGNVECFRVGDGSFKIERQLSSKDLKSIEVLAGSSADFVVGDNRASTGSLRKPPKDNYRLSAGTSPRTCWLDPKVLMENGNKDQESTKSSAGSDDGYFDYNEILRQRKEITTLETKVQLQTVSLDILSEQKEKLEGLFKRQNKEIQNKNRSIQTLSLKLRWISGELARKEQQLAKKNEIIDIQGQYIDKLEEEVVGLNLQLQRNSIVPRRRSQDVQHLNSEYRRISLTRG